MSNAEQKEQGDRRLQAVPEVKPLQAADAQEARVAGASDIQAAQDLNKNKHNGSAGGDQELSFELIAYGREGSAKVVAARQQERLEAISPEELILKGRRGDQFASSLVLQLRAADQLPAGQREQFLAKLQETANKAYGRTAATVSQYSDQKEQMDTGAMLSKEAEKNPAAHPVELFRKWVEEQPEGPQKEVFRQEVRQQAADLSPELKEQMDQRAKLWQQIEAAGLDQGGIHEGIGAEKTQLSGKVEKSEPLTNSPGGWLEAGRQIGQLPIDKQMQVIGAGLIAGVEQYQHDQRERHWGQLIGTVQGAGEVLTNLAKIAEFSCDVVCGNKTRAMERGEEFGKALGETVVSGVKLFEATQKYSYEIGYTGDYGKPFSDLAHSGMALNDRWSQLPPREQERVKYKLITEMAADGLIGAGGAKAIGKAKVFTEVLEVIATEASTATKATIEGGKRAAKAVGNAVDDLIQPEVEIAGVGRMKFPRDFGKPPTDKPLTHVLMSQADDLGNSGRLVSKGVDATGKALAFSKESGIEVGEVRLGPDKLWDQGAFPRGNDVHVVLGENLPAGTKTIDRVVFKDGIAEGQKSIDLTADTYAFPNRLESKLKGYVHDMELYKGQKRFRMSFRMQQQEIEQKVLHLGIKNGSMSESQKEVFEKIGRQIQQYNANLPVGKAPIKLKVTVVK